MSQRFFQMEYSENGGRAGLVREIGKHTLTIVYTREGQGERERGREGRERKGSGVELE